MTQLNMQLLALQNKMQMENRRFDFVSNVLKVRHDISMAATTAIQPKGQIARRITRIVNP